MQNELEHWVHVHLATGVGPKRFRSLLDTFGSPRKIIEANLSDLRSVPNFGNALANQVYEGLRAVDPQQELKLAENEGVTIIPSSDDRYPQLLKSCPDHPPILYIKGTLCEENKLALAIVGTRRAGRYGSEQAYRFSHLLAQTGFTIVSGLARGIDAQAHLGAISVNGKTIAVQGCGLKQVYPPEHKDLADKIVAGGGAIISEFPMNIEPLAGNFPARNRIVAGMTLGTLLIEAPQSSGALITSELALDYNREVFAIPANIDNTGFSGSMDYIKKGKAKLVTSIEDILDELGNVGEILKTEYKSAAEPQKKSASMDDLFTASMTDSEKSIWSFLAHGPNDIDTIVDFCNLDPAKVSATLTTLQLKGLIKPLPGNQFTRR